MLYHMKGGTHRKRISLGDFSGGINSDAKRTDIADNELSSCVNMFWRDGRLSTRNGFYADEYRPLDTSGSLLSYSIMPVSRVEYLSDKGMRLYMFERVYADCVKLYATTVTSKYFCRDAHLFTLQNTEYPTRTTRLNSLVICGQPVRGGGVFVIVSVFDEDTDELLQKHVFELDENLQSSVELEKEDIYAPLVLVNGKGNRFHTLEDTDITYPQPSPLESYNTLCGGFRAAYKTDGVSDSFTLPFCRLSCDEGEYVTVRLALGNGTISWRIAPNSTVSSGVSCGGTVVLAYINRTEGRVYFKDSGGNAYAPPYIDRAYNNLIIRAYRDNDSEDIFRMRFSESYGGHCLASGASGDRRSLVIYSREGQPLYFPQSNRTFIGDPMQSVTAFLKYSGKMLVFKSNELYTIDRVSKEEFDINSILSGADKSFSSAETVSSSPLHGSIGCTAVDTVRMCGLRPVFFGSDENVYTITSGSAYSQRLVPLSDRIGELLESMKLQKSVDGRTFGVFHDGWYYLFIGKTAAVFDCGSEGFLKPSSGRQPAWFYMRLDRLGDCLPFSALGSGEQLTLPCIYLHEHEGQRYLYMVIYRCEYNYDMQPDVLGDRSVMQFTAFGIPSTLATKQFRVADAGNKAFLTKLVCELDIEDTLQNHVYAAVQTDKLAGDTVAIRAEGRQTTELRGHIGMGMHKCSFAGATLDRQGRFSVAEASLLFRNFK